MKKAIIFKEWIKTRMVFFISLALALAVAGYAMLTVNRLIELKGVGHLWLIMLLKDNTFIDVIRFVPIAAGVAIGVAQMAPEMSQKRLKLTLHLPYPRTGLVALMLGTGLAELIAIFAAQAALTGIRFAAVLPSELVRRVMLTAVPWYLSGLAAYLFVAAICLEGTWRMRVIVALLGIAVLMICFLQPAQEAYNGMMPVLGIAVILLSLLPFGSVMRFKEGLQD